MAIQSKSTISGVTPYLLTSMSTIRSASTTIIVVKSEDLKILVLRDNWLVTNRKVNLQLGNDSLVATKAMSYKASFTTLQVKLNLLCNDLSEGIVLNLLGRELITEVGKYLQILLSARPRYILLWQ
jgi:hypothetical protein